MTREGHLPYQGDHVVNRCLQDVTSRAVNVWVRYSVEEEVSYDVIRLVHALTTLTLCGEVACTGFSTHPCCECTKCTIALIPVAAEVAW